MSKGTDANATPPHDPANPELEHELNMLWDTFYPYEKEKTLARWSNLITQAYQRGFTEGQAKMDYPGRILYQQGYEDGRRDEINYWFGDFIKNNESVSDGVTISFVIERLAELENTDAD